MRLTIDKIKHIINTHDYGEEGIERLLKEYVTYPQSLGDGISRGYSLCSSEFQGEDVDSIKDSNPNAENPEND